LSEIPFLLSIAPVTDDLPVGPPKGRSPEVRTSPLNPLAIALLVSAPATAADPTVHDLVALAPVVSSGDRRIESIELAGYFAPEGRITLTFRALYRAPDHFAFLMSDGADGTPIAFAVDRDLLVYDYARPQLMYFSGVTESDIWGAEGGKLLSTLKHNFSGRDTSRIVVDFKAMFGSPDEDGTPTRDSVVKVTDTQYILIKKRKKLYLRSRVDLTRACPFTTLEYADGPDADPHFCIDKVVVNGELDPAEFAFPSKERMADKVSVRYVSGENEFSQLEAASHVTGLLSVRDRLHKPALHRGWLVPAMMGVRWSRVMENDKAYAKLLKEIIPPGPPHALAGRPAKEDDPDTIRPTALETIREHVPSFPIKVRVRID
jgi:hypothetical protein